MMKQVRQLWFFLLLISPPAFSWSLLSTPLPPFSYKDAERSGIAIEITQLLASELERELEVMFLPWARAQRMASYDGGYLITPLTRIPSREKHYDWLLPIQRYDLQFVANDPSINFNNIDQLKKFDVCVLSHTPGEEKLIELGFTYFMSSTDDSICLNMLGHKRVQLVLVHGKESAIKAYQSRGFDSRELVYGPIVGGGMIYLASSKGLLTPEEKKHLLNLYDEMKKAGVVERIVNKYMY